ncbi:hypothetical protein [Microvirga flavescens]|uniref:hypothetical protein n=1 Tax=Microvirga flavescens TaxID=2249811 RepID=UPI000DD63D7C|nr:hypothetical protein [Microvirga flavescens]
MTKPSKEDPQARFETLLAQVLTSDEEARQHAALKNARGSARCEAVDAKATFEKNRERPLKARKRESKRQD